MQALVLAAGLGMRLRPLTTVRAKPAIPVNGRPMIRRIVAWLSTHDVSQIVVNLHALPHTLTAVLGDGSDLSVGIRYSWEQPDVLGSAGGPRHALSMLGSDPFLIVNGDTLTDLDLGGLARAHEDTGALVTLGLVPNREPDRYGGVIVDARQHVLGFVPRGTAAAGSCHFVGVQVAAPDVFRALPDGKPASSIGGVYEDLIRSHPGSIRGYVSEASFRDIGTPSDYVRTTVDYWHAEQPADEERGAGAAGRAGLAGWEGWGGQGDGMVAGRNLRISATATVERSILWDDVVVGEGCVLDRCIVTDGVHVPPSSRYRDCILVASDDHAPVVFPLKMDG